MPADNSVYPITRKVEGANPSRGNKFLNPINVYYLSASFLLFDLAYFFQH